MYKRTNPASGAWKSASDVPGPAYLRLFSPRFLLPHTFAKLALSSLRFWLTFSRRPSLTLCKIAILSPSMFPLFFSCFIFFLSFYPSSSKQYDLLIDCLYSPLECKPFEGREFCRFFLISYMSRRADHAYRTYSVIFVEWVNEKIHINYSYYSYLTLSVKNSDVATISIPCFYNSYLLSFYW